MDKNVIRKNYFVKWLKEKRNNKEEISFHAGSYNTCPVAKYLLETQDITQDIFVAPQSIAYCENNVRVIHEEIKTTKWMERFINEFDKANSHHHPIDINRVLEIVDRIK